MKNCDKYSFSDFTHKRLKKYLEDLLKHYQFVGFDAEASTEVPQLLLRHDVDFLPSYCVYLAEIEKELGISATYFFLLRSDWYNLLCKEQLNSILCIKSLGHSVGLHYDFSFYNPNSKDHLEETLRYESQILSQELECEINCFSFHNPNHETKKFTEKRYAGLINCYSKYFQDNFTYLSDSNGIWRHKSLDDLLSNPLPTKLHLLIHPENWSIDVKSPIERVDNMSLRIRNNLITNYKNILAKSDRGIINW